MRVVIVHDSKAGNGRLLAETMQSIFEAHGATVRMGNVRDVAVDEVAAAPPDLVLVGAAVRMFFVSPASRFWVTRLDRALRKADSRIPFAAVYVTHGLERGKVNGRAEGFRRSVERVPRVGRVYASWLSGRVVEAEGPLEDGTVEAFRAHASALVDWVSAGGEDRP